MTKPGVRSTALAGACILMIALAWWAYDYFLAASTRGFSGPASSSGPNLLDRTADFGLRISHRQGDERLTSLDETLGSGACALDYDGDGWTDLFIVNGSGDTRYYGRQHWWQKARGHRLLRNVHGQKFTDVTDVAGITAVSHGMGCVSADFDNDGHPDIFITNVGPNLLFRNQGDGTFRDVTIGSGLGGDGWHTAAAVADGDGDGRLDLYVGGFIAFEKGSRTYEPSSQFRQDLPPFFNPSLYPALPNHLYRNRGGLKFEDVTQAAGVTENDGRTLAAVWVDVNDDRRPDLIVLNAAGTGSTAGFLNRGNWNFEPMGIQARIESGLAHRAIALADIDNDGTTELVLTGSGGQQTALLFQNARLPGADPIFRDRARTWLLAKEQYAALSPWSPGFADFNNDGWTDAIIVNGQLLPDPDAPHVSVGQPKQLWLNDGHSHFLEFKPGPLSPLLDRQSARGLVLADFNNDGHMDLYVAHNNDLGQLLINERRSPNHWLGIRLDSRQDAPEGVGARVTVTTEQGAQTQWVTKGAGFLSDSDARLHFGLGSATHASIIVRWPDGSRSTHRDAPMDRYVTVSRRAGLKAGPEAAVSAMTGRPPSPVGDAPEIRAAFYSGLTAAASTPGIDQLLRAVLFDPVEAVRTAAVTGLAEQKNGASLGLLVRFLEDPNDSVAALAVDGVCGFEDEDTTRYLLRTFSHPSALVRQHTANCFTRYNRDFQDQKAVIQRKGLAAPYLAALLADPDVRVRIAAARALGASEEFRGVPPLVELLKSTDQALTGEAVRALGLIRDRFALPELVKLLRQPGTAPATYAQLFIALRRLDYENLDAVLRDFADGRGTFGTVQPGERLGAFLAILESPEGLVLSRDSVQQLANLAFTSSSRSESDSVLYAAVASRSGTRSSASFLIPLLTHSSPKVRSAAYLARFHLDPAGRTTLVSAALRDPDVTVRNNVLQQVAVDNVALPDYLFADALEDTQTGLAAANALRGVGSEPVVGTLVDWIGDSTARNDLRIAALGALTRSNHPVTLPDPVFEAADESLRIAMLRYEASRLPEIVFSRASPPFLQRYRRGKSAALRQAVFDFLLSRDELWAKQEVITLLQGTEMPELRRHVLDSLPPGYFRDGWALLRIAANTDDPLRFEALRRLRGITDEQTVEGLKAIALDGNEDRKARVLAACALPAEVGREILPGLLGS